LSIKFSLLDGENHRILAFQNEKLTFLAPEPCLVSDAVLSALAVIVWNAISNHD